MWSGIITAVLLVLFVGGWVWLWRPGLRETFDAAGRLALDESALDAKAFAHSANPQQQRAERGS